MYTDGVALDVTYLKKLSDEYHAELTRLETEIYELSGVTFNIASPKQLGEVLYDTLGLGGKGSGTRIKKTAGGVKSTKESELEKLIDAHPVVSKIMEYRELAKLLGTYIDTFPGLVAEDGRLHAVFSQTGTTTGRMSSQDPNLQNIPIKSTLGKRIRNAFVAPKGKKIVAIDYSQIELRIAAILSGDAHLIDIFKKGIDVHTGVASQVFKVPTDEVTKDMRRTAKVINFGILYGMGVSSLRTNLSTGAGITATREEAQNFYTEYFNTFNGIATYLEDVKRSASVLGYTKTLFGRRRYFEGIRSKLPFIRAAAERMAINAPIQGTQADITKLAMIEVYKRFCAVPEKKTKLLMQIHDELVFEIDETIAERVASEIRDCMVSVFYQSFLSYTQMMAKNNDITNDDSDIAPSVIEEHITSVPIEVSVSIGDNWGEMESR
jgi:DNA polymerase-1